MPDKKYFDTKEKVEVILPSDFFFCNRCLHNKFKYEVNTSFQAGESEREFKQICLSCGSVFYSDKKYTEKELGRYVLVDEKKEIEKTISKVEKEKPKEKAPTIPKVNYNKKKGVKK